MRIKTASKLRYFVATSLLALAGTTGCPLQQPIEDVGTSDHIVISPAAVSVATGMSQSVTATFVAKPDGGAGADAGAGYTIVWKSSNTAVATVTGTCTPNAATCTATVYGVARGDAVITAEAAGYKSSVPVKVTVSISSVTLTCTPTSFELGKTSSCTAKALDSSYNEVTDALVSWSVTGALKSVTSTARTVSVEAMSTGSGTVTATASGKASSAVTLTATLPSTATLDVRQADGSAVPTIAVGGQRLSLEAVYTVGGTSYAARDASWVAAGCSISPSYGEQVVVTMAATGSSCSVTASASSKVKNVSISIKTVSDVTVTGYDSTKPGLAWGSTATLTATPKDSTGATLPGSVVNWSASGGAVGVSAESGGSVTVSPVAVGTGTVTLTSGSVTKTFTFVVAPATLELSASASSVTSGGSVVLTLVARSGSATGSTAIPFASSALASLTLNGATGTASAPSLSAGAVSYTLTNITAAASAITASFAATGVTTVTSNAVAIAIATVGSVGLSGTPASGSAVVLGTSIDLNATVKDTSNNVMSSPITWSVDKSGVLYVDTRQTGTGNVVSTLKLGTGTVTVTAGEQSATYTVRVIPNSLTVVVTPNSIAVGGTATATLRAFDANANVIKTSQGLALAQVSLQNGDDTKITIGAPALASSGDAFTATVTGVGAGSATVTPRWTSDPDTVTGDAATVSVTVPVNSVTLTSSSADGSAVIGTGVTLTATPRDATNAPMTGVACSWSSGGTGGPVSVDQTSTTTTAEASANYLGSGTVTVTCGGKSASLDLRVRPASVTVELASSSVAVGASTTATIRVRDRNGSSITTGGGANAADISLAYDTSKLTIGTISGGSDGAFTATVTGAGVTAVGGTTITPSWTNKTDVVTGTAASIAVTGAPLGWEGSCTATWQGPKQWLISGLTGATSTTATITYEVRYAFGRTPTDGDTTAATTLPTETTKTITASTIAADVRFAARAVSSDGGSSGWVSCTSASAANPAAGSLVLLAGAGVYGYDTPSAVGATNPAGLLQVAPAGSTVERTVPRVAVNGDLVGIGVSAQGTQVLYRRLAASTSPALPAGVTVSTDASGGVCASRLGVTAFGLQGYDAAAPTGQSAWDIYTQTYTDTGLATDCALKVIAYRNKAFKTLMTGVTAVAPAGDSKLYAIWGGELWELDVSKATSTPLPRQLTEGAALDGSPLNGTGTLAVSNSYVFVAGSGYMYRYARAAAVPWTARDQITNSIFAFFDGIAATDDTTLWTTDANGYLSGTNVPADTATFNGLTDVTTVNMTFFGTSGTSSPLFKPTLGASKTAGQ